MQQLRDPRPDGVYNEAQRQIAAADVVLLNKVDLVSPTEVGSIESQIRSINSSTLIHRTTRSTLSVDLILDLNMYAAPSAPINERTLAPLAQPAFSATSPCPPSCAHDHSDPHHTHDPPSSTLTTGEAHAGDITSLTIPLPTLPGSDPDSGAFASLVRSILWDGVLPATLSPDVGAVAEVREFDVLRSKGFLLTEDGRAWVLQGVREVYEVRQVPRSVARAGEAELEPKLVLIGKGLGVEGVKERFLTLLSQS